MSGCLELSTIHFAGGALFQQISNEDLRLARTRRQPSLRALNGTVGTPK
jgi:hypothetical protein